MLRRYFNQIDLVVGEKRNMSNRISFLIGLALLAASVGSFIIFIFYVSLPRPSLEESVPLNLPSICIHGGECNGGEATIVNTSQSKLVIEEEWPDQIDINSSDSITVLLSAQQSGTSIVPQGNTPIGNNRRLIIMAPFQVGNRDALGNAFEKYHAVSATARLVGTAFSVQSLEPEEQPIYTPYIEWDWSISPKKVGLQVINLDIEIRWKPISQGGGEDILRQIWRSRLVVKANAPLIDPAQVSPGALVAVFVTFISGTGLTIPWIWEQIQKRRHANKKKKKETPTTSKTHTRLENLILASIERKGKKRKRRRPRQQAKPKRLNQQHSPLTSHNTIPVLGKRMESEHLSVSRRVVVRVLAGAALLGAAGILGMTVNYGLAWLLSPHISLGKLLYKLQHNLDAVNSIAWSFDGQRLVSGSNDNTAQVWDATDGETIYVYREIDTGIASVAWSPDGRLIASGEGLTVQVWNAVDGGTIFTYHGHDSENPQDDVSFKISVAWSPDGKRIASAGGTVQVWNAVDGGHPYTYHGHDSDFYAESEEFGSISIAWSPDGRRIASAGSTVQVWGAG